MQPRGFRALQRFRRDVYIALRAAAERGHAAPLDEVGDEPDGVRVPPGGGCEARFYIIDIQSAELPGDLELLSVVHRAARRLFPVAQGGVVDDNFFHFIVLCVNRRAMAERWRSDRRTIVEQLANNCLTIAIQLPYGCFRKGTFFPRRARTPAPCASN